MEKDKEDKGFSYKFKELFLNKRKVFLWGEVNDDSAKKVVTELLYLEAQGPGEITLYINSPGGVVTSGMIIYDTMQMLKSEISTICMGLAASMGSIILSGGSKGKRFIWPNGKVMIHQPSISGTIQAPASDLVIHAQEIAKTKQLGAEILAKNCNKPVDQVLLDFDRDHWMDAKEAISYGIVDSLSKDLSI